MQVRYPSIDFGDVRPHWAPNHEFAQSYNAFSIVPAHIEPYLVKVMMRARTELDPVGDAELLRAVEIFIKQEVQHCKSHVAFNKRIQADYPGMVEIEREYAADYARFLKEKSLRFNCAYSEGFEAMGSTAGQLIFSGLLDDLLEKADPAAVDLWKWHLAEEFEHREVAYLVYKRLFGKGLFRGYFYRVYGYMTALKHIRSYTSRAAAYLLSVDRQNMTPEELERSKAREADYQKRVKRFSLSRALLVLLPFYDPRRKKTPPGLLDYLKRFEASPGPV
jgi:predicted metal-dependent hydrolase